MAYLIEWQLPYERQDSVEKATLDEVAAWLKTNRQVYEDLYYVSVRRDAGEVDVRELMRQAERGALPSPSREEAVQRLERALEALRCGSDAEALTEIDAVAMDVHAMVAERSHVPDPAPGGPRR